MSSNILCRFQQRVTVARFGLTGGWPNCPATFDGNICALSLVLFYPETFLLDLLWSVYIYIHALRLVVFWFHVFFHKHGWNGQFYFWTFFPPLVLVLTLAWSGERGFITCFACSWKETTQMNNSVMVGKMHIVWNVTKLLRWFAVQREIAARRKLHVELFPVDPSLYILYIVFCRHGGARVCFELQKRQG